MNNKMKIHFYNQSKLFRFSRKIHLMMFLGPHNNKLTISCIISRSIGFIVLFKNISNPFHQEFL